MFLSNALILINKTPLSHNVSYAERGETLSYTRDSGYYLNENGEIVENTSGKEIPLATVTGDTEGTLADTPYGDVFKEFVLKGCGSDSCYVACSCNTANGWSDTKPESGEYYQVTSNIHQSKEYVESQLGSDADKLIEAPSTSANTLSTGVNGITTLSTSAEVKAMSTSISAQTLSSGSSTTPSNTQTCYKSKCPSGYFADEPDSKYFNVATSGGCYKATSCKSPYEESTIDTLDGRAYYSYNGFICAVNCPSGYSTFNNRKYQTIV